MKKFIMMSGMLLVVFSLSGMAESKTESFKVYGNCGMCKARIEKAAKAVDGVTTANWNKETKMMDLAFDDSKTDVPKVEMAIAKAGHDTQMHKATDKAYTKLPGCCQYDRTKTDMKMDGKKDAKMDMKRDDKMEMAPVK